MTLRLRRTKPQTQAGTLGRKKGVLEVFPNCQKAPKGTPGRCFAPPGVVDLIRLRPWLKPRPGKWGGEARALPRTGFSWAPWNPSSAAPLAGGAPSQRVPLCCVCLTPGPCRPPARARRRPAPLAGGGHLGQGEAAAGVGGRAGPGAGGAAQGGGQPPGRRRSRRQGTGARGAAPSTTG